MTLFETLGLVVAFYSIGVSYAVFTNIGFIGLTFCTLVSVLLSFYVYFKVRKYLSSGSVSNESLLGFYYIATLPLISLVAVSPFWVVQLVLGD